MNAYLDRKNSYDPKKTNREMFAEERDRVLQILNDPEAMKDRRNEGHEWSLAAYDEILADKTDEFMMETYMKTIVKQAKMSQGLDTAFAIQNFECN